MASNTSHRAVMPGEGVGTEVMGAAQEVSWSIFRSSGMMDDGLLSGTLDIALLGVPGPGTM